MCVSFRCRYIRLEKLDKSSQDTLSLLVARSGTKRNQPPPSGKQAFRLRQLILLSAGGSKVSCSRFIQFLQAHTSTPERTHDIALLVGGVKTSTLSLRKVYVRLAVVGTEQAAGFFINSQARCFGAAGTKWIGRKRLGSLLPIPLLHNPLSVRCERQAARACLR